MKYKINKIIFYSNILCDLLIRNTIIFNYIKV